MCGRRFYRHRQSLRSRKYGDFIYKLGILLLASALVVASMGAIEKRFAPILESYAFQGKLRLLKRSI